MFENGCIHEIIGFFHNIKDLELPIISKPLAPLGAIGKSQLSRRQFRVVLDYNNDNEKNYGWV